MAERRYDVRNSDGTEFIGLTAADVHTKIVDGSIDFAADIGETGLGQLAPLESLPEFAPAFDARIARQAEFAALTVESEDEGASTIPGGYVPDPNPPLQVMPLSAEDAVAGGPVSEDDLGAITQPTEDPDDEATEDGADTLIGGSVEHEDSSDVLLGEVSRPTVESIEAHDEPSETVVAHQVSRPTVEVVAHIEATSDPSATALGISDSDIDEVLDNDTLVAVVVPDESFEPEDLALASNDNPLPSGEFPPADAGPIGHGIAMPQAAARSRDEGKTFRLVCGLTAWVLIFLVLFVASISGGGGRAEAVWRPNSAVLWLRIALTGGIGGVLIFAFRDSLPISTRNFSLTAQWAAIAILAGAAVGAMAPTIAPQSPVPVAMILASTVAIAEETFFRGFIGRVLTATFSNTRTATAVAAILYGAYYATYFVVWQHPSVMQVGLALTMITVGAGLPYALLQDLTKTFTAPLLCHVALNVAGVLVRGLL